MSTLKKVWIRFKADSDDLPHLLALLQKEFSKRQIQVVLDYEPGCDLGICLSGDGSLLSVLRQIGDDRFRLPLLGVHVSRGVGFLHSMSYPKEVELQEAWAQALVEHLVHKKFIIEKRWGLKAEASDSHGDFPNWAMNEFVVSKGDLSRMISLEVWVGGQRLYRRLRGDGLIVASATGSTAYSLAAGGPVVQPTLSALLLTPICPHDPGHRPVVLDHESEIRMRILKATSTVYLTSDGQNGVALSPDVELRFSLQRQPVLWVSIPEMKDYSLPYIEALRRKRGFDSEGGL